METYAYIIYVMVISMTINQWPFLDPKLEVPIPYIRLIFEAYVREYPQKIWPKIWY